MNEYLIIRISNQQQAAAPWWIWSDNDHQVVQSGELSGWHDLADLSDLAQGRKTVLLIHGADVLLKQVTQPKGSGRHLQKMLPFLIEDEVAQEVEALHLTVVNKQGDQLLVAGVDREWFTQLWQLCQQAQLNLIKALPDVLALPDNPGITLMNWQQQWLVRESSYNAYLLDDQWLNAVCGNWQENELAVTFLADEKSSAENDLIAAQHPHWQQQNISSAIDLLASGAIHSPFSLLSGLFKVSGSAKKQWNIWRKALLAGVFLTLVYCANVFISIHQLENHSQALRTESERIFRSVFPHLQRIPTVSYLKRQMDDELARLNGGEGEQRLLLAVDTISQKVSAIAGLQVNRISFDANRSDIRLDLQGSDFQQFEAARKALDGTFSVESGPLNRNGNAVIGSLTLKEPN